MILAFALLTCVFAVPLAPRNLGMYILLADDTTPYDSNKKWQPLLHPYQQQGTNTLFFTFINPSDMPSVPPSFPMLAQTRGSSQPGSVPSNVTIMFSIGGEAYSEKPTVWPFLASRDAAEAMAAEVAKWPALYGCDGIDMDIESGAGSSDTAGMNLVYFTAKLKQLNPSIIFTQPVFGSPSSVVAANDVLAAGFNKTWSGTVAGSYGSVARVGIMVYSGEGALQYVDNYVNGCSAAHCTQWYCPLPACVPSTSMLLGSGGDSNSAMIVKLANDVLSGKLGGMMVWFASVIDAATSQTALSYGAFSDASDPSNSANQPAWATALQMLR